MKIKCIEIEHRNPDMDISELPFEKKDIIATEMGVSDEMVWIAIWYEEK